MSHSDGDSDDIDIDIDSMEYTEEIEQHLQDLQDLLDATNDVYATNGTADISVLATCCEELLEMAQGLLALIREY